MKNFALLAASLVLAILHFATPARAAAPAVTTGTANGWTWTGARLVGTVDPNLASTAAWFEWGLTTNYGNASVRQFVGNGGSPRSFSQDIGGLVQSNTYYFRIAASNSAGVRYGAAAMFNTQPPAFATNVLHEMATLAAALNTRATSTWNLRFEWGTTTNYGNSTPNTIQPAGDTNIILQHTLSNLTANTTYHFRARMDVYTNTSYSTDLAFTTLATPSVTTLNASNITTTSAALNGHVTPNGLETTAYFQWGTTTNYGSTTSSQSVGAGTSVVTVQANLSPLSMGVTYHYRVVATNSAGVSFGNNQTFTVLCPSQGTTATVLNNTEADLRAAIGSAETVNFASDGVIVLTSPIVVACTLKIDGTGRAVTISGGNSNRIFQVMPGGSLELANLTIANGRVAGTNANPGSFPLAVYGFTGGSAEGGGVLVSNAAFTARSCVFRNCSVQGGNGANTTTPVNGGRAGVASGAAIYGTNSSIILFDCTFKSNSATAGFTGTTFRFNGTIFDPPFVGEAYGGAYAQIAGSGRFFRSTLVANSATKQGGAIHIQSGSLALTNCTLTLNSLSPGTPNDGQGGALAALGGLTALASCTVASNQISNAKSTSQGSGIYGNTILVKNSILQGNSINSISGNNGSGTIIDDSHNLSSDNTPAWNSGTSLNNTDALLLPLANNGGPTPTMALRVGSPALNSAHSLLLPLTDQRGVARPQGAGPDAGAWEGAGGPVNLQIVHQTFFPQLNTLFWLSDTGVTYRIERATTLNNWTVLATNLPGNGTTVLLNITNTGAAYFRVAIEP